MMTDEQVLAIVDAAFGGVAKPEHFHEDLSDLENADHDALLRSRNRETLSMRDVENPGWDPLCGALPRGIGYFFPKLARLALITPRDSFDWYGWKLLFHLSHHGHQNGFLLYCNAQQRAAVVDFLAHIVQNQPDLIEESNSSSEFASCLALWRGGP